MNDFQMRDFATADVIRAPIEVPEGFRIGGVFDFDVFDSDENFKGHLKAYNLIPAATLDSILNVYTRTGTPAAAWFMGLVDNAGFVQFAASDVMNSHTGWAENLSYGSGSRLSWAPGASTGGAGTVTNASPISFVMTAGATIRGVFVCSDASSNASSVILLAEAPFTTGSQAVNSGDTLRGTYTLSATSS